MTRFHRFAWSLASGYVLMAGNTLFTLFSVPLALGYLTDAQFGLWALTTQIGGYIALIDAGMAGSISRILVDYKDTPSSPAYGSVIKTSACVGFAQAGLILALCAPLAPVVAALMGLAPELQHALSVLLVWQSVSLALGFALRTPSLLLAAHQRLDLVNFVQTGLLLLNYLVMWGGFRMGQGVISVIWGQIAAQFVGTVFCSWYCWKLRLLPAPGSWGHVSRQSFTELFIFARDMFLYTLGFQLVNASQVVLITRVLGLDQAALWSVCTRAFVMANQVVCKVFDFSCPAFAEMIARKEQNQLLLRFRSVCILTASLCVFCGLGFAACNNLFVFLWTKGRFSWPVLNDVLLATWLLFNTVARCHAGLTGLTKNFGFLRYANFVQGALFIGLTLVLFPIGGITAMLYVSIVTAIAIGYIYSTWRSSGYLRLAWRETALEWLRLPAFFGLCLLPVALVVSWALLQYHTLVWFGLGVAFLSACGALLLARTGLDSHLRQEVAGRIPARFRGAIFGSPKTEAIHAG